MKLLKDGIGYCPINKYTGEINNTDAGLITLKNKCIYTGLTILKFVKNDHFEKKSKGIC